MSAIGDHRFEAYPLVLKYAWVNQQPGMKAVEASADSMRQMGATLGETTGATGDAMRRLGVSWAGPASEAAQRSSAQLTRGAEGTEQLTSNGAERILEYGRSFETLRPRIAYEDVSQIGWTDMLVGTESAKVAHDLLPWTADEDKLSPLTRNADRDEEANRALRDHADRTRTADDAFATAGVDPPPAPAPAAEAGGQAGGTGGGGSLAAPGGPPTVSAASAAPSVAAPPGPPAAAGPAAPTGWQPSIGGPVAAPVAAPSSPSSPSSPSTPSTAGGAAPGARTGTSTGRGGAAGPGGSTVGAPGAAPAGGGAGPTSAAGLPGRTADPAQARARLGEQFGRDLATGSPGARIGSGSAYGGAGRPGGPVGGLAPGVPAGPGTYGRVPGYGGYGSLGGGYGGSGSTGSGTGWRGTPGEPSSRLPAESGGRGWSRGLPGEGTAVRPASGEPAVPGRSGAGYGPGYAPMMGAAGGMRSDGDAHRNRYLLPSSEPFDVDLPHSPPVLGPDEEDPS